MATDKLAKCSLKFEKYKRNLRQSINELPRKYKATSEMNAVLWNERWLCDKILGHESTPDEFFNYFIKKYEKLIRKTLKEGFKW